MYADDEDDTSWDDEPETWDADDVDDDEEEPTIPCPYCGEEMLEDAPQCGHCGNYISAEDHPGPKKPTWIILTAIVCLVMMLGWLMAL